MHIIKNVKRKELKLFLLFFALILFFSSFFVFFPISWQSIANALSGNYSKNIGDSLGVSDWNNLDNDFVVKSGDTMQGPLDMGNRQITNLATPVNSGDAVNKSTLDTAIDGVVSGSIGIKDASGDLKVFCGRTPPGATNWIQDATWYVDVDISAANFTEGTHPYIFTSLGGYNRQWQSRGGSSIFAQNPVTIDNLDDAFRIYITDDSGANFATFLLKGWFINWCAFGI